MAELGVEAEPNLQKQLTAGNLAEAIDRVTSYVYLKQQAEALGTKIRSEVGIARGIEFLTLEKLI